MTRTSISPRTLFRSSLFLALCVLAFATSAPARPAGAQNGQPSGTLNGTWRLGTPLANAQATVQQAVDSAVGALNPDLQRLARARLAESTWIPETLTIQATPAQISIQVTGQENRTFATLPGQPQNVYSRSGVRAALTQIYRPDGGIEQQLRALDGTQFNFYTPHPDGRALDLNVLIQSQRLSHEIRFAVTFQRAE